MDRATLNNKSWYRGLKVLFVCSFLLAQLAGFAIANELANDRNSYIKCDNGKELEDNGNYYYLTDLEKTEIYKKCDLLAYFISKSEVKGALPYEKRQELNSTILEMQDKGALQSEIQEVVDDFKRENVQVNANLGKTYTKEELSREFGHDITDSFKVGDTYWVSNFTNDYKDAHSSVAKIGYYALSFLIVCGVFLIISRIFFYIFAKEPFLRFRMK